MVEVDFAAPCMILVYDTEQYNWSSGTLKVLGAIQRCISLIGTINVRGTILLHVSKQSGQLRRPVDHTIIRC